MVISTKWNDPTAIASEKMARDDPPRGIVKVPEVVLFLYRVDGFYVKNPKWLPYMILKHVGYFNIFPV